MQKDLNQYLMMMIQFQIKYQFKKWINKYKMDKDKV